MTSNVNQFIRRNDPPPNITPTPPPTDQGPRRDRAFAEGLKFTTNDHRSSTQSRQLASIPHAPNFTSNNSHGRFVGQPERYQQRGYGAGILDSEVESDFDQTIHTDITVERAESEFDYGGQGQLNDDEMRMAEQPQPSSAQINPFGQARYRQSQSPTKNRQPVAGTTGAFNTGHQRHLSILSVASNHIRGQGSKKRGRSDEPAHRAPRKGVQDAMNGFESELGDEDITLETRFPGNENDDEDDDENGDSPQQDLTPTRTTETEADSEVLEVPEFNFRAAKTIVQPDSSDHLPDFPEEELKNMEYSKLSKESWEDHVEPPEFTLPEVLKDATLDEKVEHFAMSSTQAHLAEQYAFYQSLSPAEWDEAGDHILAEIGKVFQGLKDAKKNKRKVLEDIEAEIEARDKLVKGKSANINAKFIDMQAGGEGLLKGKN